jgi:hypothetical protein
MAHAFALFKGVPCDFCSRSYGVQSLLTSFHYIAAMVRISPGKSILLHPIPVASTIKRFFNLWTLCSSRKSGQVVHTHPRYIASYALPVRLPGEAINKTVQGFIYCEDGSVPDFAVSLPSLLTLQSTSLRLANTSGQPVPTFRRDYSGV